MRGYEHYDTRIYFYEVICMVDCEYLKFQREKREQEDEAKEAERTSSRKK